MRVLADKNGVRGLYSARNFNTDEEERKKKKREVESGLIAQDESDVLLKIPNKLLITPYHVSA